MHRSVLVAPSRTSTPAPADAPRRLGWQAGLVGTALLVLILVALAGRFASPGADVLLAARVNGHVVTLAQYDAMLRFTAASAALQGQAADLQSPTGRGILAADQQSALDWLINRELSTEQLTAQKLRVTPAERKSAQDIVNAYVAQVRQQAQSQPNNVQLQALQTSLTPTALQIIVDRLAAEQALADQGSLPTAHVRAIFADSQATATKLLQQVQQGADFGQLARSQSTDPESAGKFGDLGTTYVGQISPEFNRMVFAPNARPQKYMVLPAGTQFGVFEVTDIGKTHLTKDQANQMGTQLVESYLATIVQPAASIEQYVTSR